MSNQLYSINIQYIESLRKDSYTDISNGGIKITDMN